MGDCSAGISYHRPFIVTHVNAVGEDAIEFQQPVATVDVGVTGIAGIEILFDERFFAPLFVEMCFSAQAQLFREIDAAFAQRRRDGYGESIGHDQAGSRLVAERLQIRIERFFIGAEKVGAVLVHQHHADGPRFGQHHRASRVASACTVI